MLISQFTESISLEISPESLSQGELAIRQEIALQLYSSEIFTFGQARRLANIMSLGIGSIWMANC